LMNSMTEDCLLGAPLNSYSQPSGLGSGFAGNAAKLSS
jgi:hypothetical protein